MNIFKKLLGIKTDHLKKYRHLLNDLSGEEKNELELIRELSELVKKKSLLDQEIVEKGKVIDRHQEKIKEIIERKKNIRKSQRNMERHGINFSYGEEDFYGEHYAELEKLYPELQEEEKKLKEELEVFSHELITADREVAKIALQIIKLSKKMFRSEMMSPVNYEKIGSTVEEMYLLLRKKETKLRKK